MKKDIGREKEEEREAGCDRQGDVPESELRRQEQRSNTTSAKKGP